MDIDVIFLDIDGVLNPSEGNHSHIFAPECVAEMHRILEHNPQAQVVFSTTWRIGLSFFKLGGLWHQHGLPINRVISRTPELHGAPRGKEIQKWLEDTATLNPVHKVRKFAVLDDEVGPISDFVPAESVFGCDHWNGLTPEIAGRVIRHLGGLKSEDTLAGWS